MRTNAYKPHLLIIPEDAALHDITLGFAAEFNNVQLDPAVGGKERLRTQFLEKEIRDLYKFSHRYLVLIRDFDGSSACELEADIPEDLRDRVFVLGPLNEAEDLRREFVESGFLRPNRWQEIGKVLVEECLDGTRLRWESGQLAHLVKQREFIARTVLPMLERVP